MRPSAKELEALRALARTNPLVVEYLHKRRQEYLESLEKSEGVHLHRQQGRSAELGDLLDMVGADKK